VTRVRPLRAPHDPEVEQQHRMMPPARPTAAADRGEQGVATDAQWRGRPVPVSGWSRPSAGSCPAQTQPRLLITRRPTTIASRGAEMSSKTGAAAVTLTSRRSPQSCAGGTSPAHQWPASPVRSDAPVPVTGLALRSQAVSRGADRGPAAGAASCGVPLEHCAPALPTPGDYYGRSDYGWIPQSRLAKEPLQLTQAIGISALLWEACSSSENSGKGEAYMTHVVAEASLLWLIQSAPWPSAARGLRSPEYRRCRIRAGPIRSV
jgi:hypothetical protein